MQPERQVLGLENALELGDQLRRQLLLAQVVAALHDDRIESPAWQVAVGRRYANPFHFLMPRLHQSAGGRIHGDAESPGTVWILQLFAQTPTHIDRLYVHSVRIVSICIAVRRISTELR